MSRPRGVGEQSTLQPHLLLSHADQLVARLSDTGRPKTVHPRRAVSAAYYAVFHYTTIWVAYTAVPDHSPDTVGKLCRTFDHGDIEKVADWITGVPARFAHGLAATAARSDQLTLFARHFARLKAERTLADYSHAHVVDRRAALTMIGRAREAVDALDSLDVDDMSWQAFVSLVLLPAQPGKRGG